MQLESPFSDLAYLAVRASESDARLNFNDLAHHVACQVEKDSRFRADLTSAILVQPMHRNQAGSERTLRIDRLVYLCEKYASSLCFFLDGARMMIDRPDFSVPLRVWAPKLAQGILKVATVGFPSHPRNTRRSLGSEFYNEVHLG
jgi:hypothetical protein